VSVYPNDQISCYLRSLTLPTNNKRVGLALTATPMREHCVAIVLSGLRKWEQVLIVCTLETLNPGACEKPKSVN